MTVLRVNCMYSTCINLFHSFWGCCKLSVFVHFLSFLLFLPSFFLFCSVLCNMIVHVHVLQNVHMHGCALPCASHSSSCGTLTVPATAVVAPSTPSPPPRSASPDNSERWPFPDRHPEREETTHVLARHVPARAYGASEPKLHDSIVWIHAHVQKSELLYSCIYTAKRELFF